jgi:hypothetical protein
MKKILVILILCICAKTASAQSPDCVRLKDEEKTRQGYSATVFFKEKKSFKLLQGRVTIGSEDGEIGENVFIEVFQYRKKQEKLFRVVGCRTDTTGRFYFADLPKGSYKLVFSKDGGFMITEYFVKISPKSQRTDVINTVVNLGV